MSRANKIITIAAIIAVIAVAGYFVYAYVIVSKNQVANTTETQNQSSEIAGWKKYQNDQYGFEVKYPQSWHVTVFPDGLSSSRPQFAISNYSNIYNSYTEANLPQNISTVLIRIDQIPPGQNENNLMKLLDLSEAETEKTLIDGEDAIRITAKEQNGDLYVKIGNNLFSFWQNDFSKDKQGTRNIREKIINSVKFKK